MPLLIRAARGGYRQFARWREPDNFGRLEAMLTKRFENHVFLYGQDWTFLRTNATAGELLDDFFVSQGSLRPGLAPVIERHLSIVSDAAPTLDDLADEVVSAIEGMANELWHDETDRPIFELRRPLGPLDVLEAQQEAILNRLTEMNVEVAPRVVSFGSVLCGLPVGRSRASRTA